jgi:hypothetical protein
MAESVKALIVSGAINSKESALKYLGRPDSSGEFYLWYDLGPQFPIDRYYLQLQFDEQGRLTNHLFGVT